MPPHLANDVAALRTNALRIREQEKGRFYRGFYDEEGSHETGNRVQDDFPTLAAASASGSQRQPGSGVVAARDPAASRWAGIVKNGRPVPVINGPAVPRSASSSSARGYGPWAMEHVPPFSQPRQSARLPLRPPSLLPTIATGAAVSKLYDQYRENFFELGNARNKCLVKAADCWKSGDGRVLLPAS